MCKRSHRTFLEHPTCSYCLVSATSVKQIEIADIMRQFPTGGASIGFDLELYLDSHPAAAVKSIDSQENIDAPINYMHEFVSSSVTTSSILDAPTRHHALRSDGCDRCRAYKFKTHIRQSTWQNWHTLYELTAGWSG